MKTLKMKYKINEGKEINIFNQDFVKKNQKTMPNDN